MSETPLPATMKAVVTTGNGGYNRLEYRDVPVPVPGPGEVLLKVLAAGVNNTEINTRLGWYSSGVTTDTAATVDGPPEERADGGWNAATPFPLIQGTDCCGRVVQAAPDADQTLIGRRVLVRPCMRTRGFDHMDTVWMASDFDGAFAQYVKVPATEVFSVDCDWSDAELASVPCAYGTAENMLKRAGLRAGERVLVSGASGGVGSATVQLAARRGAEVIAQTSPGKMELLYELGASRCIARADDPEKVLGAGSIDLVVDNVAGDGFPGRLAVLRRGGRLVSSGAIAGPVVPLDMRELYLHDRQVIGTTAWDETVFPDLIGYVERGEIRPLVARTYPLHQIVTAQRDFLAKTHVGKFVLIPPGV
ncbi:alcohol dehydrogenase family protein [Mameliella alba]|uniref:alcohol dehydrogenase family protein n=1 Tax=Mameliella alba TaxID=561184 RepID=UPI0017BFBAEF